MDPLADLPRFRALASGAAVLFLVFAAIPGQAAMTCAATSGAQSVPLVELFTSEGCESCPAADRWLTSQFPVGPTAGDVIALAFHVDYWDRLGWKDRFATPQYTQRQRDAMRANGATFVYTPQVLVQGHDAPSWRRGVADLLAAARKRPPRANVTLAAAIDPGGEFSVRAQATVPDHASRKSAVLWLAYADSGLVSDVKAGENRGVRLHHDHVVRSLHGPYPVDGNGTATAAVTLASPRESGQAPTLVAFVQDGKSGDVLQALALPVCR